MSQPTAPPRASQITGGCLCGSVRYTISFPEDTPWPPESSTCQCTMCRKWTSTLTAHFLVVNPSQISPWPLSSNSSAASSPSTYREYPSSETGLRGFCSQCGSSLIWRGKGDAGKDMGTIDLFLGTLDEEWLVGDKEMGKVLARPNGHQFWCEKEIEGVSDGLAGGTRLASERGTEFG